MNIYFIQNWDGTENMRCCSQYARYIHILLPEALGGHLYNKTPFHYPIHNLNFSVIEQEACLLLLNILITNGLLDDHLVDLTSMTLGRCIKHLYEDIKNYKFFKLMNGSI